MKDFFEKIKDAFPKYFERFMSNIDLFLIYQGILFIFFPSIINQLLFIGLIILLILHFLKKI